ncbi:MAG: NADH-quinone oxidoreductase subunit C [Actinobacteria bacterium]|nr:NADH-quinone oxidoreductase subunit C [Actinomycetota bacterium]MCA1719688.1 NADH-quinone oxidoreductase subunit C [Actinomycetota bacterium]
MNVDVLGGTLSTSYGQTTVDVPREDWARAATVARDELGLTYFDVLTAVDERDAGFAVVLRLWSVEDRQGLMLRTRCPREDPRVPSLAGVFAGAGWHERETAELFGIGFDGHPGLAPLLLPASFEGHPLRKDFVLGARVVRPWPGAKEPGESDADVVPARRKNLPLGVPLPGSWP